MTSSELSEILERKIAAWQERSPLPGCIWPDYENGCITHVSRIIQTALGKPVPVPPSVADFATPADRVLLIIVDGLGLLGLSRFRSESPVIDRMMSAARIEPITSVCPSTTPAALTSLYTGAAPREHGLLGQNIFLREKGGSANALRFSMSGDPRRDVFLENGGDPKAICSTPTLFDRLGRRNAGAVWVPRAILDNGLCRVCVSGAAVVHSYHTPAQAIVGMRKTAERGANKFLCLYYDATDPISHLKGPYSEEMRAESAAFFRLIEEELLPHLPKDGATKVLLTADHGHALVRKSSLLKLPDFPAIEANLLVPPLGGTRVPLLYALPGRESELRKACEPLEERYHLLDSRDMLALGLWGEGPEHPEAVNRIGTLTLIPRDDSTFHVKDPAYFTASTRGDHDALSAEEMVVPLMMWENR